MFGLRAASRHLSNTSRSEAPSTPSCAPMATDPGPWFPAIPFIPNCDIHSLADNLKDDPSARFFGGMNHAFASVNAGRELARRFPQRFQGQRLFRFVAPRPEDLRVIVPMAMNVMPTIGIITVRRMIGLVDVAVCHRVGRDQTGRPTTGFPEARFRRMPRRADSGGTGRRAMP